MDVLGGKLLGSALAPSQKVGQGLMSGEIVPLKAVARFDGALHRAATAPLAAAPPVRVAADGAAVTRVAQASTTAPTAPTAAATTPPPAATATTAATPATDAAGAQERARRALDLAPVRETRPAAATGDGDRILDGLTRLRGVFDTQQGRLIHAMSGSVNDADSMIALQVEVINFSMLVDVASKLTGKTTGALETLMKGQ